MTRRDGDLPNILILVNNTWKATLIFERKYSEKYVNEEEKYF